MRLRRIRQLYYNLKDHPQHKQMTKSICKTIAGFLSFCSKFNIGMGNPIAEISKNNCITTLTFDPKQIERNILRRRNSFDLWYK